jgi:hypothetical protein
MRDKNSYDHKKCGFTDEEFKNYVDWLEKNGLLNTDKKSEQKMEGVSNIGGGITGLTIKTGENRYIAYVSKKPFVGKFPFPNDPKFKNIMNFNELYGDLLMCVGVNSYRGKSYYENRGIFRNPTSMINNDFKGISLHLHSMTGAVIHSFKEDFGQKEHMRVRALPEMHEILRKNFGKDLTTVDSFDQSDGFGLGSFGFFDVNDSIKIDTLANMYNELASQKSF